MKESETEKNPGLHFADRGFTSVSVLRNEIT